LKEEKQWKLLRAFDCSGLFWLQIHTFCFSFLSCFFDQSHIWFNKWDICQTAIYSALRLSSHTINAGATTRFSEKAWRRSQQTWIVFCRQ
jgi:hypothetical protein